MGLTHLSIHLLTLFLDYLQSIKQETIHESREAFDWFFFTMVRVVVGAKHYDVKKLTVLPSEWATVSDEAFAFLILEKLRDGKDWTDSSGAKKGMGWKNEGIRRFNELYVGVKENRQLDLREQREREYLETIQENSKKGKSKKRAIKEALDIPLPLDDF